MTAVTGSVYTAAQFNQFVRDNLNETAPAKATTLGGYFVTTSLNEIAERIGQRQTIVTSETTTSTSFTDLATVGPEVTVTTGELALVLWGAQMVNDTTDTTVRASVDVTGASTIAASDVRALSYQTSSAGSLFQGSHVVFYDDLTPGSNTFTMKYRVGAGTGTFLRRRLIVLPY
jgi:poly-gamma-glutamate capsule biosynthesis protein CapA/YwtB (metallophosphatase superfamily)